MNAVLKVDPEFESICPVLTNDEYAQLEENILSEGLILTPLVVWDGTIIDGHNRYKIAQAHPGIEFRTHGKHFESRYEALSWICKNQLGRRNLTPQDKKYLVGKRYEAEKKANGAVDGFRGNQHTKLVVDQIDPLPDPHVTRQRIADESGTSPGYVQRAERYAKGVDAAEEVLPGIRKEILSGSLKATDPEVAAIAKTPPEIRRQKTEELRIPKEKTPRKAVREELQAIRKIAADMRPDGPPAPTSEDSILETLHGAVTDMIRVCNTLFSDFPRLLADSAYKTKVIEIMQEPKQYILELEGERK